KSSDWTDVLSDVVLAINTCPTKSTKTTPYRLMFGSDYDGPMNRCVAPSADEMIDLTPTLTMIDLTPTLTTVLTPTQPMSSDLTPTQPMSSSSDSPTGLTSSTMEDNDLLLEDSLLQDLPVGNIGDVGKKVHRLVNTATWTLQRIGCVGGGRCGIAAVVTCLA